MVWCEGTKISMIKAQRQRQNVWEYMDGWNCTVGLDQRYRSMGKRVELDLPNI